MSHACSGSFYATAICSGAELITDKYMHASGTKKMPTSNFFCSSPFIPLHFSHFDVLENL
jgi:hypothetical protein